MDLAWSYGVKGVGGTPDGVRGGVGERLVHRVDCDSLDTADATAELTSCNLVGLDTCLPSASNCPCIQV